MDVNRLEGNSVQAPSLPPPPPVRTTNGGGLLTAASPIAPAAASTALDSRYAEPQTEGIESLRRAVAAVNTSIATHGRHLSINFHEPTGRRVVTVYDSETNQAIREIPPEKVLDAHASILELAGLFVDQRG